MDKPRALDEIKNDIRSRVGHRAPFNHAIKEEAEQALAKLTSIEGELWAQVWSDLGVRWEEKARKAETAGNSNPFRYSRPSSLLASSSCRMRWFFASQRRVRPTR